LILDNRGQLFLWQDTATQQLTRCTHSVKFIVHVMLRKSRTVNIFHMKMQFIILDLSLLTQFIYCNICSTPYITLITVEDHENFFLFCENRVYGEKMIQH
jgi:hypothetical protein